VTEVISQVKTQCAVPRPVAITPAPPYSMLKLCFQAAADLPDLMELISQVPQQLSSTLDMGGRGRCQRRVLFAIAAICASFCPTLVFTCEITSVNCSNLLQRSEKKGCRKRSEREGRRHRHQPCQLSFYASQAVFRP